MFDIGWTEMMVVAIVAILFVGPKELPAMLRTFGKTVKKIRALAGDFQRQFDEALKDAELDGVKDTINEVKSLNPASQIKDHLNPIKQDFQEAKKLVEDAAEFDPKTAFDESKAPDAPEPVKVDVEAALERQRKLDEASKTGASNDAVKSAAASAKPMAKKRSTGSSKPKAVSKSGVKATRKTPPKAKAKAAKASSNKTAAKSKSSAKAKA